MGKLEAIFMGRNQDLSWPIISRRSRVFKVPSKDCLPPYTSEDQDNCLGRAIRCYLRSYFGPIIKAVEERN